MAVAISAREKKLGLVAGGFVVFYVFYSFFLSPLLVERAQLKGRLTAGKTELALMETKIRMLESIEKEVAQARRAAPPPAEMSLEVLERLAETTAKSDVSLLSLRPLEEKEKSSGIKFELSCSGSYSELHDFLQGLFNLEEGLMMVDSLAVKGGGLPAPRLDIGLKVTAYF